MARIFTSRIRPSGRSRVVFINARFPEIWFSVKICLGNLRDNLNQERADDDPIADRDLVNIAPLRWISIAHCAASNALRNSTVAAQTNGTEYQVFLHDTKPRKLPGILSR